MLVKGQHVACYICCYGTRHELGVVLGQSVLLEFADAVITNAQTMATIRKTAAIFRNVGATVLFLSP